MDEDQRQENVLVLDTHNVIITEINDVRKKHETDLANAVKLWEVKHKSLMDSIKYRDQATDIRLAGMNEFRETVNDLISRCATKEEMALEINKAVALLEKAITLNVVSLDAKIRAVDIIQKVLISIVLGIILLVAADYIRGV